jgi:small-conductance mechanosensitive channel
MRGARFTERWNSVDTFLNYVDQLASKSLLSSIIIAAIIVVITGVLVHVITRVLRDMIARNSHDISGGTIFLNIIRAAIWLLGLSSALSICFDVDVSALIAALGVGGIAVSLGFRDTIANLIGGLQVSIMGIVKPGDHIRVGSLKGVVKDITWRQTEVLAADGHRFFVPNSVINAQTLEKFAAPNNARIPVVIANDGRNMDNVVAAIESAALDAALSKGEVAKAPRLLLSAVTDAGISGTIVYAMEDEAVVDATTDAIIRATAPYMRLPYAQASQGE